MNIQGFEEKEEKKMNVIRRSSAISSPSTLPTIPFHGANIRQVKFTFLNYRNSKFVFSSRCHFEVSKIQRNSARSKGTANEITNAERKNGFRMFSVSNISDTFSEDDDDQKHDFSEIKNSTSIDLLDKMAKICDFLASIFPLWVLLATGIALVQPSAVSWVKGNVMVFALAMTMLGMGTTITMDDFKKAFLMPRELISGVILQYTIMPLSGAILASIMGLPSHYAVGLILVACCPGGTASNIVTYLARGNVALSVLMTAVSTLLAVFMTPTLTALLAGKFVPINGSSLFFSTLQVVLIPVALGAGIKQFFPSAARVFNVFSPLIAVLAVALVVSSSISASAPAILNSGLVLFQSVFLLHFCGFFCGYLLTKWLNFDEAVARTVSIEVGMQNSVLGVVLATQNFANPLTAAPCALSSLCHSMMGSLLAAFWRRNAKKAP